MEELEIEELRERIKRLSERVRRLEEALFNISAKSLNWRDYIDPILEEKL